MRLFISYARKDIESIRELVEILQNGGHELWMDDRLMPGQNWQQELRARIEDSDILVFVLTPSSVQSEWCQWELDVAVRARKSIMPVLLEHN